MKNLHNQSFSKQRIFDGGHKSKLLKQILICSAIAFASGLSFGIAIMRVLN